MKKTFFCMAMVICLCWAMTVAFADATIICPEDGEILSVQDGMIHVEWDINGKSGEWVIISYTTYDTLLSDDISRGMNEADIKVNNLLKENEWYFFALRSNTGETDGK